MKTRNDKKIIALEKNVGHCQVLLFKTHAEAIKYWRTELNHNGDYGFTTYTIKELEEIDDPFQKHLKSEIEYQLIEFGRY